MRAIHIFLISSLVLQVREAIPLQSTLGLLLHLSSVFSEGHPTLFSDIIYSCSGFWAPLKYTYGRGSKTSGLNRGGLFATRLVTDSGGLVTNPPCDKPIDDCSTLHRGPRQGFITQGPRQRFETEGWNRDKPLFRATAIHVYICIYIYLCIYYL